MVLVTVFAYFFGVWTSIYLVDAAFRTHPYIKQWYIELTSRLGLSFDLFQARLFTQRLNNLFFYICRYNCIPWKIWFSCGVVFSAISMILSVCLLFLLAYNTLSRKPIETQVLTPVMPGVNLPISNLGFYILTLLVCAFLHEAGHALAAIRERVRLHGFGVFVFGFYPGAYVDLNSSDLHSLSPLSQLRVYCAGVWHNAVIALLSVVIFYMLPFLLSPAYDFGSGVGVTFLREDSVVTGQRGLSLGDAITRVNSCPVNEQSDWYKCLQEAYIYPSGYCVSGAYLSMLDNKPRTPHRSLSAIVTVNKMLDATSQDEQFKYTPEKDCCANKSSSTHLCFTYVASSKQNMMPRRYACLPARAVTERTSCNFTSDCGPFNPVRGAGPSGSNGIASGQIDPVGMIGGISTRSMYCVVPSPPDNYTRLVRLVHNRQKAPAILFFGPLDDLVSSVGISDYVPRWPAVLPPNLPYYIGLMCTYLFSLSGALVILNVVPCYALDGQWILKALMDLFFCNILPSRAKRNVVFVAIMFLGTTLLGLNLFLALYYLILQANTSENPVDAVYGNPGNSVLNHT